MKSALAALLAALSVNALADQAHVAVASNFAGAAKTLAQRFGEASGHRIALSSGSTGKFYAQIRNGAPFDAFLSADEETPLRLEKEKLGVPGSRFTYATGQLVLWSLQAGLVDQGGQILRQAAFKRLAIANPRLAPYGAAAQATLEKLGLWAALQDRLVQGENIAQTYQFVASRNAELGFVALSQVEDRKAGSYWLVPPSMHPPLRQDAVLLARGERNAAARKFLEYLRGDSARALIRSFGYE